VPAELMQTSTPTPEPTVPGAIVVTEAPAAPTTEASPTSMPADQPAEQPTGTPAQ
jgi:hypothetical protein